MENHEDSEELKHIVESPSLWEISKMGWGFYRFLMPLVMALTHLSLLMGDSQTLPQQKWSFADL